MTSLRPPKHLRSETSHLYIPTCTKKRHNEISIIPVCKTYSAPAISSLNCLVIAQN